MQNKNDDFTYDPEEEENSKGTRLPFGLCKSYGIKIEDWWTPRDAWQALQDGGYVGDVSEEYAEYYRQKKREKAKEARRRRKDYVARRKAQRENPIHNPQKGDIEQGTISGAVKGNPMTFDEADSGHVNPYFGEGLIGYRHNCQTCVAVYVARRQGYDVRALPNLDNRAIRDLSFDTSLACVTQQGENPRRVYKGRGERTLAFLDKNISAGDICSVEFVWRGGSNGHIIVAERGPDGKVRCYDPQTNEIIKNEEISKYFSRTRDIRLMNLTNVNMDVDFCNKIMRES